MKATVTAKLRNNFTDRSCTLHWHCSCRPNSLVFLLRHGCRGLAPLGHRLLQPNSTRVAIGKQAPPFLEAFQLPLFCPNFIFQSLFDPSNLPNEAGPRRLDGALRLEIACPNALSPALQVSPPSSNSRPPYCARLSVQRA